MTATAPGQRLHAALLAHGLWDVDWDEINPRRQACYEAAAREYDGDCGCPSCTPLTVEDVGEDVLTLQTQILDSRTRDIALSDRLDALTAEVAALRRAQDEAEQRFDVPLDGLRFEVAALRRDQDADLHAMGEVGNRLAKLEERFGVTERRIANLDEILRDWKDGEDEQCRAMTDLAGQVTHLRWAVDGLREKVANLDHAKQSIVAQQTSADQRNNAAISEMRERFEAMQSRALDGGDPLRRTG